MGAGCSCTVKNDSGDEFSDGSEYTDGDDSTYVTDQSLSHSMSASTNNDSTQQQPAALGTASHHHHQTANGSSRVHRGVVGNAPGGNGNRGDAASLPVHRGNSSDHSSAEDPPSNPFARPQEAQRDLSRPDFDGVSTPTESPAPVTVNGNGSAAQEPATRRSSHDGAPHTRDGGPSMFHALPSYNAPTGTSSQQCQQQESSMSHHSAASASGHSASNHYIDLAARLPHNLQRKVIRVVGAQLLHADIVHPFAVEPSHLVSILNEIRGEKTQDATFDLRSLIVKARGVMSFKLKHINNTFILDAMKTFSEPTKTYMRMQKSDVLYGMSTCKPYDGLKQAIEMDSPRRGNGAVVTVGSKKRRSHYIHVPLADRVTMVLYPSVLKKGDKDKHHSRHAVSRPFPREAMCVMTSGEDSTGLVAGALIPELFINSSNFMDDTEKAMVSALRNLNIRLADAHQRIVDDTTGSISNMTSQNSGDAFGEEPLHVRPLIPADTGVVYLRDDVLYTCLSGTSLSCVLFDIRSETVVFKDMQDSAREYDSCEFDVSTSLPSHMSSTSLRMASNVPMPPMMMTSVNLKKMSDRHRSDSEGTQTDTMTDTSEGFNPFGGNVPFTLTGQHQSATSSIESLQSNQQAQSSSSFGTTGGASTHHQHRRPGPGFVVIVTQATMWDVLPQEEAWHFLAAMIRRDAAEQEASTWHPMGLPDREAISPKGTLLVDPPRLQNVNDDLAHVLCEEAQRRTRSAEHFSVVVMSMF